VLMWAMPFELRIYPYCNREGVDHWMLGKCECDERRELGPGGPVRSQGAFGTGAQMPDNDPCPAHLQVNKLCSE
jgi:hypothetical protein